MPARRPSTTAPPPLPSPAAMPPLGHMPPAHRRGHRNAPKETAPMTAQTLPDEPNLCFVPAYDVETQLQQIRIVIEGARRPRPDRADRAGPRRRVCDLRQAERALRSLPRGLDCTCGPAHARPDGRPWRSHRTLIELRLSVQLGSTGHRNSAANVPSCFGFAARNCPPPCIVTGHIRSLYSIVLPKELP